MNEDISFPFDLANLLADTRTSYRNEVLARFNDHVVRASVMTEPFYWHSHPNSDETFFVVEGVLYLDLENATIELGVGQGYTVPANILHRTRPKTPRSVNLTFEKGDMRTVAHKSE